MKINDLNFESASCCGSCFSATVDMLDGSVLAVIPREDGLYNLSFYNDAGLVRRESAVTVEQVEALLPKT